jgi:hypothetical protein
VGASLSRDLRGLITIESGPELPPEAVAHYKEKSPMNQVEMNKTVTMGTERQFGADDYALTRAAQLAHGDYVLTDAARRMNEGGGGSLTDAARRMNEGGGGSLADAYERCHPASLRGVNDGAKLDVRAAPPPGATPPSAPTSPALDPRALEILHKAADAAEKVHGTGRFSLTA